MTINVSLIMTPFPKSSFWTGVRMLCGKDARRNDETEWRIYYSDDILPAFLTTIADPSHSFSMTINVSLIMTPFPKSSFWTGVRMLCGKDARRNDETEWRIYYSDDILPAFLTTIADPSHSFSLTPYRPIQEPWSRPPEGARWRT